MDDRQRIVNNWIEALKRDCKSSGSDEFSNIATTSMYRASTGQSDYHPWKVSSIQSNSAGSTKNPSDLASVYSTAQTGHNEVDWQEECYQKIKTMKELYLSDLNDMYQKISIKYQQRDSVLNAPKSEQIERLKMFKNMVERILRFLNLPKNNIVPAVKEKLSAYEKQIIGIINSNKPRQPVSAQQQIQQPGGHPLSMQPQQPLEQQQQQQQQPGNQLNHQMQPTNMQNSASSSKQSTDVTSTSHGAMPLLSNHMELSSAQTFQSISNTNMFKFQFLEHQKQQLEQQFLECQMYQEWINQQMQYVLQQQQQILQEQQQQQQIHQEQQQQQQQILQEQQQQIPQLQQQFQQLALQQFVQLQPLQAANQMSQLQVTPPP